MISDCDISHSKIAGDNVDNCSTKILDDELPVVFDNTARVPSPLTINAALPISG